MSGEARQDFIFEMFKAGAADYLVKPIRRNEITALWQHAWRSMQDMAKGIPSSRTPLDLKVHNPVLAANVTLRFTAVKCTGQSCHGSGGVPCTSPLASYIMHSPKERADSLCSMS